MHPGDTAVMFSLAALYLKENQFAESKQTLLNILTLDPGNKDAADLLEEVQRGCAEESQTQE
jgi:hypothetical protein